MTILPTTAILTNSSNNTQHQIEPISKSKSDNLHPECKFGGITARNLATGHC